MVKAATNFKISDFFTSKNKMVEPTVEKMHKLKGLKILPGSVWMDNGGENKLLKQRAESKDWKLGLKYEYTARSTPQQNSVVEVAFATLTGRATAMMARANVPKAKRHAFFGKAAQAATLLDGLVPAMIKGVTKTRFEHKLGSNPPFAEHLQTWEEAGTVTIKEKMHTKGQDKGVICMFVGYTENHAGDCYDMWDPTTNGVYATRDVVWLRRMFFNRQDPVTLIETNTEVESEEVSDQNAKEDDDNAKGKQDVAKNEVALAPVTTAANPKILSEHSNNTTTRIGRRSEFEARFHELQYAVMESSIMDVLRHEEQFLLQDVPAVTLDGEWDEIYLVGAGMGGGFINTQELHVMEYKEAMAGADADKWSEAVMEEHTNGWDLEFSVMSGGSILPPK